LITVLDALREALWGPGAILAVQAVFGPSWLGFFEPLSLLGNMQGIILVVAVALWIGGQGHAYRVLCIGLLGVLISAVFWHFLSVPRPDDPRIVVRQTPPTSSFPSGHVVTAMTLWGSLSACGWLPTAMAMVVVPLVMLSRLYLGVHYLGDVLGGLLIGLFLLVAFPRLWRAIVPWLSRPSFWVYMAFGVVGLIGAIGALFLLPTYRSEEIGMIAGVAVGLPLEYRCVRFAPAAVPHRWQALKLLIGLGGVVAFLGMGRLIGSSVPTLHPLLAALASLWALLAAPALFVRLGLARRPVPSAQTPHLP
jgi:membrane-associated phospholipid phosphatase